MPKTQFGTEYYDQLYLTGDRTYERPLTSPYYRLYRKVIELIRRERLSSVLEVGCGSGVLAEMLIADGVCYDGFDLSPIAVGKAQRRNPEGRFFVADAADPMPYQLSYDGLVCCEVLEHIDGDLTAIEHWKSGTICVCSVPNFDYESHVRFFRSEEEIGRRYGGLLDIWRFRKGNHFGKCQSHLERIFQADKVGTKPADPPAGDFRDQQLCLAWRLVRFCRTTALTSPLLSTPATRSNCKTIQLGVALYRRTSVVNSFKIGRRNRKA